MVKQHFDFGNGDRVRVLATHWHPAQVGKTGRVYSSSVDTNGNPTHWVKFDGGSGEFVLAVDLEHFPVDNPTRSR